MSTSSSQTPNNNTTKPQRESQNSSVSATATPLPTLKALHVLHSPDGYYTYLNIPPPTTNTQTPPSSSTVDDTLIKKNYRRLSLKHHPDRDGGDAETFRLLTRAKKVLTTDALRKQYDLLGVDLDDQEEGESGDKSEGDGDSDDATASDGGGGAAESIVGQLASVTLASILQIVVRTVMICVAATVISRFKILIFGFLCLLGFVAYRTGSIAEALRREYMVPSLLGVSVIMMHYGRIAEMSFLFWVGESLMICLFLFTSLPPEKAAAVVPVAIITVSGMVLSGIVRGRFWRYAIVLGIEVLFGIVAVLVFPIMEMILEEIMDAKMRKVGEKIRDMYKMKSVD